MAGLEFIDENGGGPGLRLRNRQPIGQEGNDLDQCASSATVDNLYYSSLPWVILMGVARLTSVRNGLLASLAERDAELLIPHLHPIEFTVRQNFYKADRPITNVVFPESGIASVVASTRTGHSLEVGIIGREGMIGVPVILGETRTPYQCYAQVGGHGLEMKAINLWAAMQTRRPLADVLLRFAHAFLVQVTHSALAISRSTIEQRLARWLLMAHDRVDQDDVPLTHAFLSMMLGCRRASVTDALDSLEGRGVIRTARGHIFIRDRRGLEELAGTCYGVPESELTHGRFTISRNNLSFGRRTVPSEA